MIRPAHALGPAAYRRLRYLVLIGTAVHAIARGISYLPYIEAPADDTLSYVETYLPLHVWGWLWITVGLAAVAALWVRELAVPAMSAYVFLAMLWGTSYIASWWILGEPDSIAAGATYLLVTLYAAVLTVLIERPARRKE